MVSVFSGLVHILVVSFYVLGVGNVLDIKCMYTLEEDAAIVVDGPVQSSANVLYMYQAYRKCCAHI